jgi:hypothetical protein
MARKIKDVTIDVGRDAGKTFRITEMPVTKADKWANTALLAMLELARVVIAGLGNVTETVGQDLLDQLINECVQALPSGGSVRPFLSVDDEIEDVKTLWILRKESFLLHIDFLAEGSSLI